MIILSTSLVAEELDSGRPSEEALGPGPHDGAGDWRDPAEVPVEAAAHPWCHWGQEAAAAKLLREARPAGPQADGELWLARPSSCLHHLSSPSVNSGTCASGQGCRAGQRATLMCVFKLGSYIISEDSCGRFETQSFQPQKQRLLVEWELGKCPIVFCFSSPSSFQWFFLEDFKK